MPHSIETARRIREEAANALEGGRDEFAGGLERANEILREEVARRISGDTSGRFADPEFGFDVHHRQVTVKVDDYEAPVDEGLAELIETMWKAGVWTIMSCEENRPGVAWIELHAGYFQKFLNMVLDPAQFEDEPSLYSRISSRYDVEGSWEYKITVDDYGIDETVDDDEVTETHSGKLDLVLVVDIRFPRTDIPLLLEAVDRVNRGQV